MDFVGILKLILAVMLIIGVYDLKLHEFRKGQSDDYISLSTKVDYIPWNPNNPTSKKILQFFYSFSFIVHYHIIGRFNIIALSSGR